MKKLILKKLWVSLLLISGISAASAREVSGDVIQQKVTAVWATSDMNFKDFEVIMPEEGVYFAEFWLLPAEHPDHSYTSYQVYLNHEYVGSIDPTEGNWQGIRLSRSETLGLEAGRNIISVGTEAPEIPIIESVKIASGSGDASFSSTAYDNFRLQSAHGRSYGSVEGFFSPSSFSITSTSDWVTFTEVPLLYTFFGTYSFTQGQEIEISSSSLTPHDIDLVYFGSPNTIIELGAADDTQADINSGGGTVIIDPVVPVVKPMYALTPATSLEMQGFNWRRLSERPSGYLTETATLKVKIPQTGTYLVRLRTRNNGATGVADVNVNGLQYYNVPISLAKIDYSLPHGVVERTTVTLSDNNNDDPYLFIHGSGTAADRIVGYNDDASLEDRLQYGLMDYDAAISLRYRLNTSGISVCNYWSSRPISYCTVITNIIKSNDELTYMSPYDKNRTGTNKETHEAAPYIKISDNLTLSGNISITADEEIREISVYSIQGACLGTINSASAAMTLPVADLNIVKTGCYVIQIKTETGLYGKKVFVK